jgi:DNA-binding MarR family transcriptional regulator
MEAVAPTPTDTRELASDLVTYSARLVRAVRRISDLPASIRILSVIDQYGALGVSQLAAADRSSQPSMSTAVQQLVADGLVDKQPHPDDGRSSVVTLTAQGRRELSRARRTNGDLVAARFAATDHSAEDLATAVAVLRDVLAIDEEGTP